MMAQSIKDRRIAGVIVNHVATMQRPPLAWKFLQHEKCVVHRRSRPTTHQTTGYAQSRAIIDGRMDTHRRGFDILLRMQVPRDPDQKLQYGCALAAMGDTSVVQNVAALTQGEGGGGFRHAMALIQDLLS